MGISIFQTASRSLFPTSHECIRGTQNHPDPLVTVRIGDRKRLQGVLAQLLRPLVPLTNEPSVITVSSVITEALTERHLSDHNGASSVKVGGWAAVFIRTISLTSVRTRPAVKKPAEHTMFA